VTDEGADAEGASSGAAKATTLTGLAAFVLGGVGTIVAAIGDFGSDDSALAAARRNHVYPLLGAAGCAALGLMLGGLFILLRSQTRYANDKWKDRLRWLSAAALGVGIAAVAVGVAIGAFATTDRKPGRPTIQVERIDRSSLRVQITSEGFPSRTWFEAVVEGFGDAEKTAVVPLATGRFSPGQDGKIDWKVRVYVPPVFKGTKIERLRVLVQRDRVVANTCTGEVKLTCLSLRIPRTVEAQSGAGEK
jgi:hypothetical protein